VASLHPYRHSPPGSKHLDVVDIKVDESLISNTFSLTGAPQLFWWY
jgi:hypothetical protein